MRIIRNLWTHYKRGLVSDFASTTLQQYSFGVFQGYAGSCRSQLAGESHAVNYYVAWEYFAGLAKAWY